MGNEKLQNGLKYRVVVFVGKEYIRKEYVYKGKVLDKPKEKNPNLSEMCIRGILQLCQTELILKYT